MNVMMRMVTALSCVTTLLVATSATVRMDTHWTLMNTLAMVCTYCKVITTLMMVRNRLIFLVAMCIDRHSSNSA